MLGYCAVNWRAASRFIWPRPLSVPQCEKLIVTGCAPGLYSGVPPLLDPHAAASTPALPALAVPPTSAASRSPARRVVVRCSARSIIGLLPLCLTPDRLRTGGLPGGDPALTRRRYFLVLAASG